MTSQRQHSIQKVLIANRGEIACRIMKTCESLGIQTVAIHSPTDASARFVKQANEAVQLKSDLPHESYLDVKQILDIATKTGADAIHPGYGFLAENAVFSQACAEVDIIFIGPDARAIDAMGDKRRAKELMKQHDVPTIPGYEGDDQSVDFLAAQAEKIGLPVLVKASAGGGGKGMRIVHEARELQAAIASAQAEAKAAFGDEQLIIERYFDKSRHIEVQIIADQHNNTYHLFERDCSTQRRFQKIIEEAPAPNISAALRKQLHTAAIKAAQAVNYTNAGTVEFLVAGENCYFLEMNTRLQVEHPVTEAITGLDLVALQIHVAEGKALPIRQQDIECSGHAIQARLYAEDPLSDFRPAAGAVLEYRVPEATFLREDTALNPVDYVSPLYDPMISKLIVHADDRQSAIRQLRSALLQTSLIGITSNRQFVEHILKTQAFQESSLHTRWIALNTESWKPQLTPSQEVLQQAASIAAVFRIQKRADKRTKLKNLSIGWRNNPSQHHKEEFLFAEEKITIEYAASSSTGLTIYNPTELKIHNIQVEGSNISFIQNGIKKQAVVIETNDTIFLQYKSFDIQFALVDRHPQGDVTQEASGDVRAPLPGRIESISIQVGDSVHVGDALLSINSMKMSNTIFAAVDGTVQDVFIALDDQVEANARLVLIEE